MNVDIPGTDTLTFLWYLIQKAITTFEGKKNNKKIKKKIKYLFSLWNEKNKTNQSYWCKSETEGQDYSAADSTVTNSQAQYQIICYLIKGNLLEKKIKADEIVASLVI